VTLLMYNKNVSNDKFSFDQALGPAAHRADNNRNRANSLCDDDD
jgi:hypothetical protein